MDRIKLLFVTITVWFPFAESFTTTIWKPCLQTLLQTYRNCCTCEFLLKKTEWTSSFFARKPDLSRVSRLLKRLEITAITCNSKCLWEICLKQGWATSGLRLCPLNDIVNPSLDMIFQATKRHKILSLIVSKYLEDSSYTLVFVVQRIWIDSHCALALKKTLLPTEDRDQLSTAS